MKITVNVPVLQAALKQLAPVTAVRGALPVLSGVRLDADTPGVAMTASDLELTLRLDVGAVVHESGTVIVHARRLQKIVATFPKHDAVTIEGTWDPADATTEGRYVTIECGGFKAQLNGLPVDEYPRIDTPEQAGSKQLDAAAFRTVAPVASNDDNRPILTGVHVVGNEYVATDSYQLAKVLSPKNSKLKEVIIPARIAKWLPKDGFVPVNVGKRDMSFFGEGFALTTRLIDGQYPNYKGLIPDNQPDLITYSDPVEFRDAVSRMATMASALGLPDRVVFENGGPIRMSITDPDIGRIEDVVEGAVDGQLALNPTYLSRLLNGSTATKLTGIAPLKPVLIAWTDDGYEHTRLLMPIRVQ